MQTGCYTLHLYCDNNKTGTTYDGIHDYFEFPHQYANEYGNKCRKQARKDGWILARRPEDKDLCPKCSGKKKSAEKNSTK